MLTIFSYGRLTGLFDCPGLGAPAPAVLVIVGVLLAVGRGSLAALPRVLGGGAAGSLARSGVFALMPFAVATFTGVVVAARSGWVRTCLGRRRSRCRPDCWRPVIARALLGRRWRGFRSRLTIPTPTGHDRGTSQSMDDQSHPQLRSRTLGEVLGITGYERPSDDLARAEIPALPRMQPYGAHGGAYAVLAESIRPLRKRSPTRSSAPTWGLRASEATTRSSAVSSGTIRAEARPATAVRRELVREVRCVSDGTTSAPLASDLAVQPLRGD